MDEAIRWVIWPHRQIYRKKSVQFNRFDFSILIISYIIIQVAMEIVQVLDRIKFREFQRSGYVVRSFLVYYNFGFIFRN